MRILVLQLARFGDLFQTWPTLKALQRQHPDSEVHVLVRERFHSALDGCAGITVHHFSTAQILEPIFTVEDLETAHARLVENLSSLGQFDLVINLSFSPMSSYLADYLAIEGTEIRGYTRTADGHLAIADDTSAYFYAQVGVGRSNRYHLTHIFAAVAGVDLQSDDFNSNAVAAENRHGIVVHLGASQLEKSFAPEDWVRVLKPLGESFCETVFLIGSVNERALSETVAREIESTLVVNQVGKTQWPQTRELIAHAKLLIGADSAPIHLATLTNTPTLNLSSATVNYWETGPLAQGSRVLYRDRLFDLPPQHVYEEALAMLAGRAPQQAHAVCNQWFGTYDVQGSKSDAFTWELVQALYTDAHYPALTLEADRLAFQRYNELSELALQQLAALESGAQNAIAAKILAQIDELLIEVSGSIRARIPCCNGFKLSACEFPPVRRRKFSPHTIRVSGFICYRFTLWAPRSAPNCDRGQTLL